MDTPMPDYGINFSKLDSTDEKSAEKYAEEFLNRQLSDPDYKHKIEKSELWGITKDNGYFLLEAHVDVYSILSLKINLSPYIGIIIHTTGWAAPLNENGESDIPPSLHEAKRRVALVTCVTESSMGSALSFADEPELILDSGSAVGAIVLALSKFWKENYLKNNSSYEDNLLAF